MDKLKYLEYYVAVSNIDNIVKYTIDYCYSLPRHIKLLSLLLIQVISYP